MYLPLVRWDNDWSQGRCHSRDMTERYEGHIIGIGLIDGDVISDREV